MAENPPDRELALPNGRTLMQMLALNPEMLRVLARVPVPVLALRALIGALVSREPFDPAFYAETYPDLAAASESGAIADLRTHFLQFGYIEGRIGARPEVDEEFYKREYPDVGEAIDAGRIASAYDHYVKAGSAEGRFANSMQKDTHQTWRTLLGAGSR
jgi:hypothetical protein